MTSRESDATQVAASFDAMWSQIESIGRAPSGGYRRYAWNDADLQMREWFADAAGQRGLDVRTDRNGNLWAWWLPGGDHGEHREPAGAFVTGSHLDSVPDGGAFDGPLGVVSALCAVDALRTAGVTPSKPVAVVVFADEEGARFGNACTGSRLTTGVLDPDRARGLRDADGTSLAEAMRAAGFDPGNLGRDDEALRRIGVFVELHIEQGRALVDVDAPVGLATGIWPHGRWRFSFIGRADHAGTTRLADRRDPVLPFAATVLAARQHAEAQSALATFGRTTITPNATNGIASRVDAWLDARAEHQQVLDELVGAVVADAAAQAHDAGVTIETTVESFTPAVQFDMAVRARLASVLAAAPLLPTGAGHDAGVLAAEVATGMVFVRNPSGVSHSPHEFAGRADCLAGVDALVAVMQAWLEERG
jgi:N-carbamoyl-L-amino-acid hydrolase